LVGGNSEGAKMRVNAGTTGKIDQHFHIIHTPDLESFFYGFFAHYLPWLTTVLAAVSYSRRGTLSFPVLPGF
jgi:hypothetical protein